MAKSTGNTGYLVGLVFSILISLGLLYLAYDLNKKIEKKQGALNGLRAAWPAEADKVRTLRAEHRDIRKLLTGDPEAEVNAAAFEETLLSPASEQLDALVAGEWVQPGTLDQITDPALQTAWTKLERQKGEEFQTLAELLSFSADPNTSASYYDMITAVVTPLPFMRHERLASREEWKRVQKELEDQREQLRGEVETLRGETSELHQLILRNEETFDTAMKGLWRDKEDAQQNLARRKRTFEAEESELGRRIRERELRIKDLKKKTLRSLGANARPDGEVVHADPSLGWAWIDLGRRNGLRRNTVFQVYNFVKGGLQKIKGVIVVRHVDEDMSQCQILDDVTVEHPVTHERVTVPDPEDPIVKGDLVRTPLFDPHEQKVFVFLGDSPQNDYYTLSELRTKLEEFGARVDRAVSIETDFVILLGGSEEDQALQEQIARASTFGVEFMVESDLLDYMGR